MVIIQCPLFIKLHLNSYQSYSRGIIAIFIFKLLRTSEKIAAQRS